MSMGRVLGFFTDSQARIAAGMGLVKCARAVLTVAAVMISAGYFGASLERDAWVLAASAVTLLTQILFGPVNETFRVKYLHRVGAEGESEAQRSAAALLKWVVVLSTGVSLIVALCPGLLMAVLAPGFSGAGYAFVARVLAAYFPSLILAELILLLSSMLNAYRSYYLPEFFAIASVALSIAAMVLTARYIGIYSLVIAAYLSQGILLLILVRALRRRRIPLWPDGLASWRTVMPYFWFGMPLYLCYLTGQLHAVVERRICTILGEGSVSILDYARKFLELPMSVLMGVAASVVAPLLARQVSDKTQFAESALRFVLLFYLGLIPFCGLLIFFPSELVQVLLLHGAFKPDYAPATATAVRWFGVGALGLPLYVVGGQALLACHRRRRYVVSSVIGMVLSAAINLLAYRFWGVATLAMSWALFTLLCGGVMMAGLPAAGRCRWCGRIASLLPLTAAVIVINLIVASSRDAIRRIAPPPWPTALVELGLATGLALIAVAIHIPFYRQRLRDRSLAS